MSVAAGQYLGGVIDRESLKSRCWVDDSCGCWVWKLPRQAGSPSVTVRLPDGSSKRFLGRSAAMYVKTGVATGRERRAIPTKDCATEHCMNPDHSRFTTLEGWGKWIAESGQFKGSAARMKANRAINIRRSKLTREQAEEVRNSDEKGIDLAAKFNCDPSIISAIRRGVRYRSAVARNASVFSFRP